MIPRRTARGMRAGGESLAIGTLFHNASSPPPPGVSFLRLERVTPHQRISTSRLEVRARALGMRKRQARTRATPPPRILPRATADHPPSSTPCLTRNSAAQSTPAWGTPRSSCCRAVEAAAADRGDGENQSVMVACERPLRATAARPRLSVVGQCLAAGTPGATWRAVATSEQQRRHRARRRA
jgi:hypothetical protein